MDTHFAPSQALAELCSADLGGMSHSFHSDGLIPVAEPIEAKLPVVQSLAPAPRPEADEDAHTPCPGEEPHPAAVPYPVSGEDSLALHLAEDVHMTEVEA